MKKAWTVISSAALSFALLLVSLPAFAEPAFVLNSGRDGLVCTFFGFGFSGAGDANLVATSSGEESVNCHGEIDQDPPEETLRFSGVSGPLSTTCNLVITRSGRFNINCKN